MNGFIEHKAESQKYGFCDETNFHVHKNSGWKVGCVVAESQKYGFCDETNFHGHKNSGIFMDIKNQRARKILFFYFFQNYFVWTKQTNSIQ